MIKEVKISVIGIQNFGYEPEEVITTNTTGKYCYEKKNHRIEYVEIDEYGNTTKNFVRISEERIQIEKSGSVFGIFRFVPYKKTRADYKSYFGRIIFEVATDDYHLNVQDDYLRVQLRYRLFTNKKLFSTNVITITVRCQK